MGDIRNGARTFLNILAKACKLSHLPGFQAGLSRILGNDVFTDLMAVWTPVCTLVDLLVSQDNWFNQIDAIKDDQTGEDVIPL